MRLVAALVETASVYCVSSVRDVDSIDLQACLSDHSDPCLSTSSDVMATCTCMLGIIHLSLAPPATHYKLDDYYYY